MDRGSPDAIAFPLVAFFSFSPKKISLYIKLMSWLLAAGWHKNIKWNFLSYFDVIAVIFFIFIFFSCRLQHLHCRSHCFPQHWWWVSVQVFENNMRMDFILFFHFFLFFVLTSIFRILKSFLSIIFPFLCTTGILLYLTTLFEYCDRSEILNKWVGFGLE